MHPSYSDRNPWEEESHLSDRAKRIGCTNREERKAKEADAEDSEEREESEVPVLGP